MGLLRPKAFYVTDRGDSHQIDEMEVSHLMNAINHHRKQINTIDWILEDSTKSYRDFNYIHRRRMGLFNTVEALINELMVRDPDKDPDPTEPRY